MKLFYTLSALALAAIVSSCGPSIDTPKKTSLGYQSAKLIAHNPDAEVTDDAVAQAKEKKVHDQFQSSLGREFRQHGLSYSNDSKAEADLTVAYLILIQNNAITFHYNDYFGQGRDADGIAEYAHLKGATQSKRNEFFERAIIVIDIIDNKTKELVYRNHYAKDIVDVPTDNQRKKRLEEGIKQTLQGFFKQ